MRILVLSDAHGRRGPIERVLSAHPEARAAVFLGDGLSEFLEAAALYPSLSYYSVGGNCDYFYAGNPAKIIELGGKRVFFTHGHLHGVKSGTRRLADSARQNGADIALYGHTHAAFSGYEGGLYLFNPGSVSRPRAGPPSYGMLDITPAGVVPVIVRL